MAVRARSLVEKSFCRYYNDIMIKRFDRIDVATTDINDAASIYEKNFGFKVTRSGESASVSIGGA
ncbi:MAG TPA: hypothetical protein VKR29_04830, partial [Candidatus Binataceae bacterium]|nr:hypothetical protein [Candidatus Binataceae bacterium]